MIPDWNRIFPDADHRWTMGLWREDSAADFFADDDPTGGIRAERAYWLADEPHQYAALLPEAEPALRETVEFARQLGTRMEGHAASAFEQLLALGRAWEPDFVWMHPGADGVYQLIGGVVCFPSFWNLEAKIGRPMREVHDPVPGLNPAIGRQIDTFFAKQAPGEIWRRENWNLAGDHHRNHHLSRPHRSFDAQATPEDVWVRLEHQLLLKLPESKSVLFGIHIEIMPLTEVMADPPVARRFARLIETMSPESAEYKRLSIAGPALVNMLRTAAEAESRQL